MFTSRCGEHSCAVSVFGVGWELPCTALVGPLAVAAWPPEGRCSLTPIGGRMAIVIRERVELLYVDSVG
jgi:hypothetical protein